jgi:hypothetical protein
MNKKQVLNLLPVQVTWDEGQFIGFSRQDAEKNYIVTLPVAINPGILTTGSDGLPITLWEQWIERDSIGQFLHYPNGDPSDRDRLFEFRQYIVSEIRGSIDIPLQVSIDTLRQIIQAPSPYMAWGLEIETDYSGIGHITNPRIKYTLLHHEPAFMLEFELYTDAVSYKASYVTASWLIVWNTDDTFEVIVRPNLSMQEMMESE